MPAQCVNETSISAIFQIMPFVTCQKLMTSQYVNMWCISFLLHEISLTAMISSPQTKYGFVGRRRRNRTGGRDGWSFPKIENHPRKIPRGFSIVVKMFTKFKETGTMTDKPRSSRPNLSAESKEFVVVKVCTLFPVSGDILHMSQRKCKLKTRE